MSGIQQALRPRGHSQLHGSVMEPDDASTVGSRASAPGECHMTNKPDSKDTHKDSKTAEKHPGMMGDGTEEQNLGQPGNPGARIKKDEVDAAFDKNAKK
jgi:hypothetical protein